jgi:hypothetical protein
VAELPCLQKILDSEEQVYASYACARMYPERVNTGRMRMSVEAGMVKEWDPAKHDVRLKQFYGKRRIVHAGNYDEAFRFALQHLIAGDAVRLPRHRNQHAR